jgi:hypothetical protein
MKFNFPPFFYVKAFWEALSYFVSGVLGLLVVFEKLSPEWALSGAVVLAGFLGVLRFLGVSPAITARAELLKAQLKGKKK